jgi:hypothetical protein
MSEQDLPTLAVEDIQAMPEAEWEALCERISQESTTYLFTQNGVSTGVVMVPYREFERMVRATGGAMPSHERTPDDDRFAETFASLRGTLKDGPDLEF